MRLPTRLDRSKRKKSTRTQRIGFAFFWVLVVAYAYVIPVTPNFNTESHLYLTFSMVDHATVNIDAYHRRLGDESFWHGHYYSDKAPGLSLLAVPVYAAFRLAFPGDRPAPYSASGKHQYSIARSTVYARYVITYVLLILPSALFCVLLWLFLSRYIGSGWALCVAAVYGLGTTAYPYSMWYFSHQVCAMLLFGAFLLLHRTVRGREWSRSSLLGAAGAGLLAGYAVISEYPTIVIALCVGAYAVLTSAARLRSAAAFALGALPPAILAAGYNTLAFGKPLSTGYQHVSSAMYHNQIKSGILGLSNPAAYGVQAPTLHSIWEITLGSYRGLFFFCPVLLLFFAGLAPMWRRRELRPELWLCALVVALYVLMDASRGQDMNGWSGGWAVVSRHLVPMLPFMVVPLALGLTGRPSRALFLLLGAISVLQMSLTVAFNFSGGFNFNDHNPLAKELWPAVSAGKTSLNWGYLMGLHGPLSLVPALLVMGALLLRILWLFHAYRPAARALESPRLRAGAGEA